MRAVFFGTPDFAIASIRALLDAGVDVPLVCTRPARRAGRGRVETPTPVARFAEDAGIAAITPERLDQEAVEKVRSVEADVFVVVAYGRFIPSELLDVPRLGVVNLHPSLLPRHRGPSPVATAILEGDEFTGVTVMLLDEGMDTGPILSQSETVEITLDTRCDELTERLFEMGAGMLPGTMRELGAGRLVPRAQDDEMATVTRLIRKEDGMVDWDDSAERIVRMNRAFLPWPGTSTTWDGASIKLVDIALADGVPPADVMAPGEVFRGEDDGVYVCAGSGSVIRLTMVQAAGRRAMGIDEFVVGRPEFIGSVLGG